MSGLTVYIMRQVAMPLVFFTCVMTGVIWLAQALGMLDLVIDKGQTALVYLELSSLVIPRVLQIVLPIAAFCAALYTVNRLYSDSELVVMFAAGVDRWTVARPLALVAALIGVALIMLQLYITPMALREVKTRIFEIRNDVSATLIREGEFKTPSKGLTVFIERNDGDGSLYDVFVHDNRDVTKPVTYMAEQGMFTETDEGPRLIMFNGNIQRVAGEGDGSGLSLLYFDKYSFDLSQFINPEEEPIFKASERYLHELLFPDPKNAYDRQNRLELIAEGHARLASPLYPLALMLIALAVLTVGDFSRRGYAKRMGMAIGAAIGIKLLELGFTSASAKQPALIPMLYLVPILGCAAALGALNDRVSGPVRRWGTTMLARLRPAAGETGGA